MKTITLPDELNLENLQSVNIFDYCSSKEIAKQQIILNQHTFSFLMKGNKEVVFNNSTLSIDNSKFLIMKSGHCLMTEKLSSAQNYRSVLLFFSNDVLLKFIRKNELNRKESNVYKSVYSFKYDEFIDELLKRGIEPIPTLYHFEMPVFLYEKYNGFASRKVVDIFVELEKLMFFLKEQEKNL